MQNLDKDHIAAEAQFHMGCHNQYLEDAAAARARAEGTADQFLKKTFEGLAVGFEDVAQQHLDLYNQKRALLEGGDHFQTQLIVNSCGILLHA